LNLDLRFNGKAADGTKLDWAALSAQAGDAFKIDGSSLAQIARATDIAVTGRMYINISGFVIALADFSLVQQSGIAINDTKNVSIALGNALVIQLSNAYLFVGVDGTID